ncbi:MAG TPA: sialidase family protein [Acidimicrobiales bacterium]|nr:sialidase family protein [Acidimicrobiales bacterium]
MRRLPAAAAAAGLLLVALVLVAAAVLARSRTTVGQNVFVNPSGIIDAFSTPSVAVNPDRPSNVVVTYREDRPDLSARLGWSNDGGASFAPTALPLPSGADRPFFPDAAFAPGGVLDVAYVNLGGRGNVPANLWVAQSRDGGRHLSAPVLVTSGLTFQPRIAVGPMGTVSLTWLQSNRVGQAALTGDMVRVMMSTSGNGGRSWSPPVPVSAADGNLVSGASGVFVGHSFVVVYERFGPTASNLGTGGTAAQPDTYDIVVTRSPVGRADFSPPMVVTAAVRTTQRFSLFFPQFPSLAGGGGRLYLAWAQGRGHGQDALVAASADSGATWSKPVRANDNPGGDGTARLLPTMSVAPSGRVDLVLIDERNDPSGNFADAYLASSTDQARSFHDLKLSTAAFDTRVGPTFGGGLPPDLGSHLAIASQPDFVQAAWADSRLGNENTGRQDIVTARIHMTSSSGRTPLLIGGAAVAAVAAAGLLAWRRRLGRIGANAQE